MFSQLYPRLKSAILLATIYVIFLSLIRFPYLCSALFIALASALLLELYDVKRRISPLNMSKGLVFVTSVVYVFVTSYYGFMVANSKWQVFEHLILLAVISDSVGYFAGSYFQGPKLMPRISPNKTVSGFACSLIASFLITYYFNLPSFLAVVPALGDLLESAFKRMMNIKDMSNLIKGHGGLLDRLDSILPLFPCYYTYINLCLN